MVDRPDSKSGAERRGGSSPLLGNMEVSMKKFLKRFTSWLKEVIFDMMPENDESHGKVRYKE